MSASFRSIWARRTKDLCGAAPAVALGFLLVAGCAQQAGKPGGDRAPSQSPPATKSGSGTTMAAGDVRAILAYHNKVRTDVGVGPLRWSAGLASYAQEWADHLADTTCKMAHRSEHKYGENLFQGTAGHFSAEDAAKAWETEKKDYGGGALTPTNWHPAGHYTQMVWRETTAFGCGEALCRNTLIVACNYDPPGNVLGRKPY
jgi:pathogenesis-related protein 1